MLNLSLALIEAPSTIISSLKRACMRKYRIVIILGINIVNAGQ